MALIKNKEELSTTNLRKDALEILEAGLESILTANVVRENVRLDGDVLYIKEEAVDLSKYGEVFLIGIGKCALDACSELEEILGERISDGIVLDVRGGSLKRLRSEIGTHPLPSEKNTEVAGDIAKMLKGAKENDLILNVISGGGSALLCYPNDMSCSERAELSDMLMDRSASISEMNTVRKHTSKIKGGQFARMAYPARLVSMIFSDVPGDDLSVIASGPTVKDETTVEDAAAVLSKYKIEKEYSLIETPKDDKYFENVSNILLLTNKTALEAMADKAQGMGYKAEIVSCCIEGEADRTGKDIASAAGSSRVCKLYGGETTVTIKNPSGKGGRNQKVALSAIKSLPEGSLMIAVASDGWDNNEAAGALVDDNLKKTALDMGLDPDEYLENDSSFDFFEKAGGHIMTGKTGTNVSDIYFTLSS